MKLSTAMQEEFNALDYDIQVHCMMLFEIVDELCRLSKKKVNKSLMEDIILLHDSKNREEDHAKAGAEYAKNVLARLRRPRAKIEKVYRAILHHSDKPKVKDFTVAAFYDADILCRFYSLGVLRAWENIKADKSRDWKAPFLKVSSEENLTNYIAKMRSKLNLSASKKLLDSKKYEYLASHALLKKMLA